MFTQGQDFIQPFMNEQALSTVIEGAKSKGRKHLLSSDSSVTQPNLQAKFPAEALLNYICKMAFVPGLLSR